MHSQNDNNARYRGQCDKEVSKELYFKFIELMRSMGAEYIATGTFKDMAGIGAQHCWSKLLSLF